VKEESPDGVPGNRPDLPGRGEENRTEHDRDEQEPDRRTKAQRSASSRARASDSDHDVKQSSTPFTDGEERRPHAPAGTTTYVHGTVPAAPGRESAGGGAAIIAHRYRKFGGETSGRLGIIRNIVSTEIAKTLRNKWILVVMILCWLFVIFLMLVFSIFLIIDPPGDGALDGDLFLTFYSITFYFVILFAAMLGGRLITDDLTYNLLPLYFSRPMTKLDYLVGKFLTMSFFLSTVTVFPVTFLFILAVGTSGNDFHWVMDQMWLLGGIWLHGGLVVITFSVISSAFSSLTRKANWAMAGTLVLLVSTEIAGVVIAGITRNEYGILFSIWINLMVVGGEAYGVDIPLGVEWYYSLAVICGLIAAALAVVVWQVIVKEGNR